MTQRVNYDAIAASYDAHPFRQKAVDPDADYQSGLARIEQALKENASAVLSNEIGLIKVIGHKPA